MIDVSFTLIRALSSPGDVHAERRSLREMIRNSKYCVSSRIRRTGRFKRWAGRKESCLSPLRERDRQSWCRFGGGKDAITQLHCRGFLPSFVVSLSLPYSHISSSFLLRGEAQPDLTHWNTSCVCVCVWFPSSFTRNACSCFTATWNRWRVNLTSSTS